MGNRRRAGFTLMELLMAMVVLSLLMLMLFAVFNQASRGWLQAENRVETFQNSRAALDFMAKELVQTVTTTNSSFLGNTNSVAFVAPVNTGTNMDLAGVAYQLAGGSAPYTLIRGVLTNANWYSSPQNWPMTIVVSNTLADNIVSLTLSYTDTSGTPQNYWNSTSSSGWPSTSPGQTLMIGRAPAGVQITIGAIDSRAAKRLAVVGGNATAAANILNQATQYFSTYVAIPNGQ